jgi:S-adenosylmethionine:tRNA ribosyltransferase-isomerase
MSDPRLIDIRDFNYSLPPDNIAQFPLPLRDASKLLVYRDHQLTQAAFSEIASYLEQDSLLVFNETKVVRARLIFFKPTGAEIEVFCLEPIEPAEIQSAFLRCGSSTWKCLVGNSKRWKNGFLEKEIRLGAEKQLLVAKQKGIFPDGTHAIEFSWQPENLSFSGILESAGQVPLPPYIHRAPDQADTLRYQTIYARNEGSVAAPTAGLHFTDRVLNRLKEKGCSVEKVTLHVGLGTFKPVTANTLGDHLMHQEKIEVSLEALMNIQNSIRKPLIAVGTTAARTLESLYWMGCKCLDRGAETTLDIGQWEPYGFYKAPLPSPEDALSALIQRFKKSGTSHIRGNTRLIIVPGYEYKMISGLITNFHMPQSTLLLLVSALIGDDWKNAYAYALKNGYRFLSYGDSCLFFKT